MNQINDEEKEIIKLVLSKFEPTTEEDQKWFLICLVLCYIEQKQKFVLAKSEEEQNLFFRDMGNYEFMINFMTGANKQIILNQVKKDYKKICENNPDIDFIGEA